MTMLARTGSALGQMAGGWRAGLAVAALLVPLAIGGAAAQDVPDGVTSAAEIEGQLTRGLTIGEPEAVEEQPVVAVQAPAINLNVQFALNSDRLTDQARAQLNQLGTALQGEALKPFRFEVAGHTDATGSDSYNLALSERRAQAVYRYLISQFGIDASRLTPIGFGETKLLDSTQPDNPANRRVQITNLGS